MHEDTGDLGRLKPAPGSIKKPKRIGRGRSSGHGDTATRGHKGAKSRSGYSRPLWFEGGQMPIHRRLPKRGFHVPDRTEYREFKLSDLGRIKDDVVNPVSVRAARLVNGRGPIVLLGNGEVDRSFKVSVHRITKSAQEKITAAGGSVEIIPLDPVERRVKRGPSKRNKYRPKERTQNN